MGLTLRRIVGILGFVAAVITISVVIWGPDPAGNPVLRIFSTFAAWVQQFRSFINELLPELPPFIQPYLQGYGDLLIISVGVLVLALLLFERERIPAWVNRLLGRLPQAQQPTQESPPSSRATGAPPPKPVTSETFLFSSTEVINAPIDQVWESLRATNCGPTCAELLGSVKVSLERDDTVLWAGTGNLAQDDFHVEGATRLDAPNLMEVECIAGALKGFKATFRLLEVPSGTRVREKATFDLSSVPSEFSTVAPKLSAVIRTIVEGDLPNLRRIAETKSFASQEGPGTVSD